MQKHQLYINLLVLSSAFALAACADKGGVEDVVTPPAPEPEIVKTPIELSMGGVETSALTRAASDIITNGDGKTMISFDKETKVFMVMKSEYDQTDHGKDNYEGADKAKDKYTVSQGVVNSGSALVSYYNDDNIRYWDDAHARSSQLSIWAYAAAYPDSWNDCTFQIPNPSYDSQTMTADKEYMGYTFKTAETDPEKKIGWYESVQGTKGAIYPCIMTWNVSNRKDKTQDNNTIVYQDLLFSNNLANNGTGMDGRLKFNFTDRTFPQQGAAQLKFYHAMSKITIYVVKGEGFADADFNFLDGNIKLSNFNTVGTFNIKNGHFELVKDYYEIPQIYCVKNNAISTEKPYTYELQALAIPNIDGINSLSDERSRFDNNSETTMMEFTIGTTSSNNTYKISAAKLYKALVDNSGNPVSKAKKVTVDATHSYVPLEAGKNYVFVFTIGKKKIDDITAQIADWENVNAIDFSPSNARINLNLEERGTPITDTAYDLYRSEETAEATDGVDNAVEKYNWPLGFVGHKNEYKKGTDNVWGLSSPWYWPNNITFYHFRAILPAGTSVGTNKDSQNTAIEDYAELSSASSNWDVRWGAPMLDDVQDEAPSTTLKWNYSLDYGFDGKKEAVDATPAKHQIYKAIGPTEDQIKLILFHAMSELNFTITTTTDENDKVDLGDGNSNKTIVKLEGFYPNGQILLGNGLVKTTGSLSSAIGIDQKTYTAAVEASGGNPAKAAKANFVYGVVPQDLTGVQLRIITPDNNEYLVPLNNLETSADNVKNDNIVNPYTVTDGKVKIGRWYPNFRYNYTFTLKKKGMADVTVTVLDWEEVSAEVDNVQIQ